MHHVLVNERFDVQRFHDIGDKLRVDVHVANFLVQQCTDRAVEFGADLLRLVGHIELRHLAAVVSLHHACEHANKRRFASAVLAKQNNDLRITELPRFNLELECAHCFRHRRVAILFPLLLLSPLLIRLRHAEGKALLAETKVLRWDKSSEENVDTLAHGEGHGDDAVGAGHAVEAADEVGEVVEDGKVVLHADHKDLGAEQRADAARSVEALLDVQVRRGLVEHVNLRLLHHHHSDGEPL
mmetsp:Transcript_25210/g.64046  ORF Transcript_25210/g.64046 Transcript_25210/m.64046 type:complete len:241 (-) Transcript_25210:765-1487(-)